MSAVLTNAAAEAAPPSHCPQCGSSDPSVWFASSNTCVTCRSASARARAMGLECDRLAHEIAIDTAMRQLEKLALVNADGWYDASYALLVLGPETRRLETGIQYLLFRGHLVEHPIYSRLYRVIQAEAAHA